MGADWSALTYYLRGRADDRVTLSWSELDRLVGGMPASAINHAAWWGGDRPHSRAWKAAGFDVESKSPGRFITFRRAGKGSAPATEEPRVRDSVSAPQVGAADVVLITCVKSKRAVPSAAKDLYTSTLFGKQRAYAESLGTKWFILSAEWGLVRPDDWLSPYERYLPDTEPAYQEAWGAWVVARLNLELGSLHAKVVEVHASQHYVARIAPELEALGAIVLDPLRGLSMGQRLSWYDARPVAGSTSPPSDEVGLARHAQRFVELLSDPSRSLTVVQLVAKSRAELDHPGLYSWWVDESGARELSTGLGHAIEPGLIYAGLAGATRWPSGSTSGSTLRSRIRRNHLGSNHRGSTLRRALGSVLAEARAWPRIDESALTEWMYAHLRVIAEPYDDADTLGRLEHLVLGRLDPPLNLDGMPSNATREALSVLRF